MIMVRARGLFRNREFVFLDSNIARTVALVRWENDGVCWRRAHFSQGASNEYICLAVSYLKRGVN
jgi:hypothetical protein